MTNFNLKNMTRICWIAASSILLICGVMHVYGTFFSTDLYPANAAMLTQLKVSNVQMDKSGIFWNLWIGFNAMFGASLIFIGCLILNFSIKKFEILRCQHFVLLLTIATNAFFSWIGIRYMITAFTVSMLVPLLLFVAGYIFTLPKFSSK